MERRTFIQSLSASLLYPLLPNLSWAQTKNENKLLFIKIEGGWDTSLFADPWVQEKRPAESDYFIEYKQDELLSFADSWVGPALAPLKPYFHQMAIVNGILVNGSDNGHTSSMIYMETGSGQGESAHFAAEAEFHTFGSPLGTASSGTLYTGFENRKIIDAYSLARDRKIQVVPEIFNQLPDQARTDLQDAITGLSSNREAVSHFNELLKQNAEGSLDEKRIILALLQSGLSSSALYMPIIQSVSNIDSHSGHPQTHLSALKSYFEEIRKLLEAMQKIESLTTKGRSLFDETTTVIYSEFSRTPALNGSRGKDHNPQTNSMILLGPGIKHAKVGGSRLVERSASKIGLPYLVGLPLKANEQPATHPQEAAFFIRPETVLATLAESLHVSRSQLNEQIKQAKILKTILK